MMTVSSFYKTLCELTHSALTIGIEPGDIEVDESDGKVDICVATLTESNAFCPVEYPVNLIISG